MTMWNPDAGDLCVCGHRRAAHRGNFGRCGVRGCENGCTGFLTLEYQEAYQAAAGQLPKVSFTSEPKGQQCQQRPLRELFIAYAYDDPDDAPVLAVSHSLNEVRRDIRSCDVVAYCYRVTRLEDGSYGNDEFIEQIGSPEPTRAQ